MSHFPFVVDALSLSSFYPRSHPFPTSMLFCNHVVILPRGMMLYKHRTTIDRRHINNSVMIRTFWNWSNKQNNRTPVVVTAACTPWNNCSKRACLPIPAMPMVNPYCIPFVDWGLVIIIITTMVVTHPRWPSKPPARRHPSHRRRGRTNYCNWWHLWGNVTSPIVSMIMDVPRCMMPVGAIVYVMILLRCYSNKIRLWSCYKIVVERHHCRISHHNIIRHSLNLYHNTKINSFPIGLDPSVVRVTHTRIVRCRHHSHRQGYWNHRTVVRYPIQRMHCPQMWHRW